MPFVADLRTVLRRRDFRRLFAVRLVSQAGDGAFQVALASLIFFSPERAATAGAAAGALAASVLPYTLVGPFAGVLLDRWRRRQILLVANAVRVVIVLGIAALVASGVVGPALYVVVLAALSVNRFFLAGLGASLPHVVPRHELVMANAVSPTCGTLAAIGGGFAAYGVRAALGTSDRTDAIVLVLAAVTYGAAALLATRMAADLLGPDHVTTGSPTAAADGQSGLASLVDGARHVRERRPAFHALAAIGVHRFAYGISFIATLLLCRNHFVDPSDVDAGFRLLALVFGASAVGFALAALITPAASARWRPAGWIWRCFAAAAVTEYVFVATISVPLVLVGAVVLGIAAQGSKICVDAIVQASVDDDYRGRVFAFYDVVFNLAFVVAAATAALVVPADGYSPPVYALIASLYVVAAVGYARAAARRVPIELAPQH
ncbi:MAG TPA: MFS transporter [Actinomycetales bacterium]